MSRKASSASAPECRPESRLRRATWRVLLYVPKGSFGHLPRHLQRMAMASMAVQCIPSFLEHAQLGRGLRRKGPRLRGRPELEGHFERRGDHLDKPAKRRHLLIGPPAADGRHDDDNEHAAHKPDRL